MELIRGISGLDKEIPLGPHVIKVQEVLEFPFHISFSIDKDPNHYTGILDGLGGTWEPDNFRKLLKDQKLNVELIYETISEFTSEIVAGVLISQEEEEKTLEAIFKQKEIQESLSTILFYPHYLKYRRNYLPMGFKPVTVIKVFPKGVLKVLNGQEFLYINFQNKTLNKIFNNKSFESTYLVLRLLARKEIFVNGNILTKTKGSVENSEFNPYPTEIYFCSVNLTSMLLSLFEETKDEFLDEFGEEFAFVRQIFEKNQEFCQKKVVDYCKPYQSKLLINQSPNFDFLVTEIVDPITFKGISFEKNAYVTAKVEGVFFPDQSVFQEEKLALINSLYFKYVSTVFSMNALNIDSRGAIISTLKCGTEDIKSHLLEIGACLLISKGASSSDREILANAKDGKVGLHKNVLTLLETWNFDNYPETILGTVSHLDQLSHFYIQSKESETHLKELEAECQVSDKVPLSNGKKGSLCLALYEGNWYRAQIKQVLEEGKMEVLFFDYGNGENVSQQEIIEMPVEFYRFPKLAYQASFFNLLFPSKGHELYNWVLEKVSEEIDGCCLQFFKASDNQFLISKEGKLLNSHFVSEGFCRLKNESLSGAWLDEMKAARTTDKGIWTCHDSLEEGVTGHSDPLDYLEPN